MIHPVAAGDVAPAAAARPWSFLRLSANQETVAQQSVLLLAASVISRLCGVLRGIVVARILAPADYGLLATILVAAFYVQLCDLGVGWGTVREIPLRRGRGETSQIARLEREVFWWEVAVGTAVGVATMVYLVVTSGRLGLYTHAWMFLPVYVAGELLRNTQQCFLQAREEFTLLRRSMIWQAVLDLALSVALTERFGLVGATAALALTSVTMAAYLVFSSRAEQIWKFARMRAATFRMLTVVGFPLMVQNLMWANMTNVDKLVILARLNTEALAYYAMAQTIAASLLLVSGATARVSGPIMIRRFGETGDATSLYSMLFKTLIVLTYGLPVLVAGIWLTAPLFFANVLPKYIPSVQVLDVSIISFYAMAVTMGASSLYVALERQVLNGMLLLGGMVLTVVLGLILINMDKGTSGVAVASAVSSCMYLVAFVACGFNMVGRTGRALARDIAIVLLPLALCVCSLVGLQAAAHSAIPRLWLTLFLEGGALALALWGMKTFMHASDRLA